MARSWYLVALLLCWVPSVAAQQLSTVRVASGLSGSVFVSAPAGDLSRLFIVEEAGRILILDLDSLMLLGSPFLDITDRVTTAGDGGLFGLAFADDYLTSGIFYVYYTAPANPPNCDRHHCQRSNRSPYPCASWLHGFQVVRFRRQSR